MAKRGTPDQMSNYKHALQLYKLHNSNTMTDDWISLNVQQNFNGRNEKIQFFNIFNYKVGRNLLVNRFKVLNNKIDYFWFNESFNTFKVNVNNFSCKSNPCIQLCQLQLVNNP